jgi:hypothetical protein
MIVGRFCMQRIEMGTFQRTLAVCAAKIREMLNNSSLKVNLERLRASIHPDPDVLTCEEQERRFSDQNKAVGRIGVVWEAQRASG